MKFKPCKTLGVFCLVVFASLAVEAATMTWAGGSGDWNSTTNWSTGVLPGPVDDAVITNAGTYTVTISANASAGTLTVGASSGTQSVALSSGTLTLNGSSILGSNVVFTLAGGTLTGSGDVTINGTLNWSGGTMSGSGRTIMPTGSVLNVLSSQFVGNPTLGRVLQNTGTINWNGPNGVWSFLGGTLNNLTGGMVDLAGGGIINNSGGVCAINNAGTWNNTNSYTTTVNVPFNNSGSVSVNAGLLNLQGGGAATGGSFVVATGAGMGLGGGHSMDASTSITGAGYLQVAGAGGNNLINGTVNLAGGLSFYAYITTFNGSVSGGSLLFANGGTVNFNGTTAFLPSATFDIFNGGTANLGSSTMTFATGTIGNGGTLTGTGDLTISGTMNWSGGTMNGTGRTIIAANTGTLNINGNPGLGRVLENDGTATWTSSSALSWAGGTLNNNGTFTVNSGSSITSCGSGAGANAFNNAGTFIKQGAGTLNFTSCGAGVSFNNSGSVDVQGGTLQFETAASSVGQLASDHFSTLVFNGSAQFPGTNVLAVQQGSGLTLTGNLTGSTSNSLSYIALGSIVFNGSGTAGSPQLLEVMGRDVGTNAAGFSDNFVYGKVSLANGTYVRLVDQSRNSSGTNAEALYVNAISVPSGATFDLNGLHVYTRATQVAGNVMNGAITSIPDGGPIYFGIATPGKIGVTGEQDEWTFSGHAGQTVTVVLDTGSGSVLSPKLGYGEVRLLGPSTNILTDASNSVAGQAVVLTDVTLPADGMYQVKVQAPASQPASVGNYLLTVWDTTEAVTPLVVNQRQTASLKNPYGVDRWTFSAIANQQLRLHILNVSYPGIVFDLVGPNGWVGLSNLVSDSGLLTLPFTGAYTLKARGTGAQYDIAYSFELDFVFDLITLQDHNSIIQIDPTTETGMFSWSVDQTNQIFQHWFWLSAASNSVQTSLDTFAMTSGVLTAPNAATLNYLVPGLSLNVGFNLKGGILGSQSSDLAENFTIQNITNIPVTLHFFEYADFDLADIADQDTVSFPATNAAVQEGNGMMMTETTQGPAPNYWEAGWYDITLAKLDGTSPVILSDKYIPQAPGDQTYAYEWAVSLNPGQNFLLNLNKSIHPIPVQLSIAFTGSKVLISWPTNGSTGFQLQSKSALSGSNGWIAVTNLPALMGGTYQIALPTAASAQFYRLRK